MLKKILFFTIAILLIGCGRDENQTNQTSENNETKLEGVWFLQNNSNGSKLTFEKSNFTIKSGTVTINGTFHILNNKITGQTISRSGANSNGLQPDNFTGNFEISNNRVTFTNFDGNWRAVFSTWYGKQ
ncbi:hypothetical protein [Kaistella antarctica]|uniref:Lipocalin-like domain-containing protein n=1 Tax=Kaistella antarctica TaxID=266748 RepID=A0A3S5EUT5_9FLAO|nr:hypothetical protein [Kaistella antarctica]KEY18715.1 hypothetical protein HY04_09550 [Kaistella antarctica]SEW16290.1 hypothetical protein SAMN05421765_2823 [Kaistella antarctica]VEH99665.1 Uncharacterised protein [Kaistella antarctica]